MPKDSVHDDLRERKCTPGCCSHTRTLLNIKETDFLKPEKPRNTAPMSPSWTKLCDSDILPIKKQRRGKKERKTPWGSPSGRQYIYLICILILSTVSQWSLPRPPYWLWWEELHPTPAFCISFPLPYLLLLFYSTHLFLIYHMFYSFVLYYLSPPHRR